MATCSNRDIYNRLALIEKIYHTVEDCFGDSVPHVHKSNDNSYCGVTKLDELQTYKNIVCMWDEHSKLCSHIHLCFKKTCNCSNCHKCFHSHSYTKEYIQHAIEVIIGHGVNIFKCWYKYVEKIIDHVSVLNVLAYALDVYSDAYFWFLDICDKKNISLTRFICILCERDAPRSDIMKLIIQRYNTRIYKDERLINDMINMFDTQYIKCMSGGRARFIGNVSTYYEPYHIERYLHGVLSVIELLCEYSNEKYKFIWCIDCDIGNGFLGDICKKENSSVSGITLRHMNMRTDMKKFRNYYYGQHISDTINFMIIAY